MCRKLLETICNVKERENENKKFTYALPVLVTKIMENWMSAEEIDHWKRKRIIVKNERMLSTYKNAIQMNWTIDLAREHVRARDVQEEELEEIPMEVDSDDGRQ